MCRSAYAPVCSISYLVPVICPCNLEEALRALSFRMMQPAMSVSPARVFNHLFSACGLSMQSRGGIEGSEFSDEAASDVCFSCTCVQFIYLSSTRVFVHTVRACFIFRVV